MQDIASLGKVSLAFKFNVIISLSMVQTLSCQALGNWTVWEMWVLVPNGQIRDPSKQQCSLLAIGVSHCHHFYSDCIWKSLIWKKVLSILPKSYFSISQLKCFQTVPAGTESLPGNFLTEDKGGKVKEATEDLIPSNTKVPREIFYFILIQEMSCSVLCFIYKLSLRHLFLNICHYLLVFAVQRLWVWFLEKTTDKMCKLNAT